MNKLRFRHAYTILGNLLVIALWLLTDPDTGLITNLPFGASTIATLVILLKSTLYITLLHVSRKALWDYLDLERLYTKAVQTPEGAGYATISVALSLIAIAIVILAATTI